MSVKFSSTKNLEGGVLSCVKSCQFNHVTSKQSGESGYVVHNKIKFSTKTFENSPDLWVLPSSRFAGTREALYGFLKSANAGSALAELLTKELQNPMTAANAMSDAEVQSYVCDEQENGTFSFLPTKKTTFKDIFEGELAFLKSDKKSREDKKEEASCDLLLLPELIHYIKHEQHKLNKIPIIKNHRVNKSADKPKENLFLKRAESAANNKRWLDVTNCKEHGSNIVDSEDKPTHAYVFTGYPELSRCFFKIKRDRGVTSPHKNLKNVGPAYCLKNYLDNSPRFPSKTMPECIVEVGRIVKEANATRERFVAGGAKHCSIAEL